MAILAPEELAQFRSECGLNQREFADFLNEITGRHYTGSTISAWERGHKTIPGFVQEVIQARVSGEETPELNGHSGDNGTAGVLPPDAPGSRRPDLSPPPPDDFRVLPVPVPGKSALEEVAIEMFRGIGQTIEMVGAFSGQPKVVQDGQGAMISLLELDGRTITGDAETLGKAWAHLAAQNAWVARILTSMTSGGAWVEVIMATSGTVFKVYKNHAGYNEWLSKQSKQPEPTPEPAEDGSLI